MNPLIPTYSKIQFLILVLTFVLTQLSHAQIGINTLTPDSTAALDINGIGSKGVLIPRLTKSQRESLSLKAVDGLLVYDKTQKMFYFWCGETKQWESLNLFKNVTNIADTNIVINNKIKKVNVGIGYSGIGTDKPTNKLDVKGAIKTDTVKATYIGVNLGTGKPKEKLEVNGNIKARDTLKTTTVIATSVNANQGLGIVPKYGIIPYGGPTTAGTYFDATGKGIGTLSGWALCNGNNGTPNLQDRFIVGAGSSYIVGATGGANTVTLTANEMPVHSHDMTGYRDYNGSGSDGRGFGYTGGTSYQVNGVSPDNRLTLSSGGGSAHENRPPYYALTYIMRIN